MGSPICTRDLVRPRPRPRRASLTGTVSNSRTRLSPSHMISRHLTCILIHTRLRGNWISAAAAAAAARAGSRFSSCAACGFACPFNLPQLAWRRSHSVLHFFTFHLNSICGYIQGPTLSSVGIEHSGTSWLKINKNTFIYLLPQQFRENWCILMGKNKSKFRLKVPSISCHSVQ